MVQLQKNLPKLDFMLRRNTKVLQTSKVKVYIVEYSGPSFGGKGGSLGLCLLHLLVKNLLYKNFTGLENLPNEGGQI